MPIKNLDKKTYREELLKKKISKKVDVPLKLKLYRGVEGTTINSSLIVNQEYIDTNPGPYSIEGGSQENPIIISFSDFLTINLNTYFIINCDFVKFTTLDPYSYCPIVINNILSYSGLIHNLNNSVILIENIGIFGENSSLEDGAGWIIGSYFGVNCNNNLIQHCSNNLPIGLYSGGIVGMESKIDVYDCYNNGELLNTVNIDGYNIASYSGGICGMDCESNIERCFNYGRINGIGSGGIISDMKGINLTIKDCFNTGDIVGEGSCGIIRMSESAINIESCNNRGNITEGGLTGILGYCEDLNNQTNITSCNNYGDLSTYICSGICWYIANGQISESNNYGEFGNYHYMFGIGGQIEIGNYIKCKNYTNISAIDCAGISQLSNSLVVVSECENYGNISGEFSSGIIIGRNLDIDNTNSVKAIKCKNYGFISGNNSSGIFITFKGDNFAGIAIDCSNDGEIISANAGGIVSQDSIVNVINCVNTGLISGIGAGGIYGAGCGESVIIENSTNNGAITGANSGGIFGSWCSGTAKDCINAGSVLGISTGGIFGEFSNGTSINSVNNALLIAVNSRNV